MIWGGCEICAGGPTASMGPTASIASPMITLTVLTLNQKFVQCEVYECVSYNEITGVTFKLNNIGVFCFSVYCRPDAPSVFRSFVNLLSSLSHKT